MRAYLGDPGADNADERGLVWDVLDAAAEPPAPLRDHRGHRVELDSGVRATAALGVCSDCGAPVVSVSVADYDHWTAEHGPAWSTPWVRLTRHGEPR